MELIVDKDFRSRAVRIYLKVMHGSKICIIGQKDNCLIEQTIEPSELTIEPLMPLLEMPEHIFKDLVKCVSDYASQQGVKSENENLLAGKLSATEKHLEDLRIFFPKVLDKLLNPNIHLKAN